jgi:RNA polymerase sigma-70 factor (ECF subfamily)
VIAAVLASSATNHHAGLATVSLGSLYALPVDVDAAGHAAPDPADSSVLAALRAGDEEAFAALVDQYHASMVRVARAYVATKETAEDVAQEAWIGVVQGLSRFEGRSSLKTWIFRIVINKAMTRGGKDARSVPFSSLGPHEPAVDPSCFRDSGRWQGWWVSPDVVGHLPEALLLSKEARTKIDAVIATLPPSQRLVITLRDIQGMTASEACDVLNVSEANQRVLLHRARSKLRAALENYVRDGVGAEA